MGKMGCLQTGLCLGVLTACSKKQSSVTQGYPERLPVARRENLASGKALHPLGSTGSLENEK